jgi:hypothetical protein
MALTKEITQDKIEVVGASKHIQIRTRTAVLEDGVELSASFHRHVVQCVFSVKNDDDTWTHTDTDRVKVQKYKQLLQQSGQMRSKQRQEQLTKTHNIMQE